MPHAHARGFPSPSVWLLDRIPPVGQDRLILTRSGSGDPELQRWPDAPPRFSIGIRSPRGDNYRNGVMKHPRLLSRRPHTPKTDDTALILVVSRISDIAYPTIRNSADFLIK